ncbi:unnamed protein product [Merluccius merluccius]
MFEWGRLGERRAGSASGLFSIDTGKTGGTEGPTAPALLLPLREAWPRGAPLPSISTPHPSVFPTVKLQWDGTMTELSYPLPPNHHRLSSRNRGSSEETHRAVEELCRWSGVGLSPTQKHQLQGLLEESRDIFAACDDTCTQTHLVQHEIDTGDAHPVHCWPQ